MIADDAFDPAAYRSPEARAALISDALASGDPAFVRAALRTALQATDLTIDVVMPEDPRLSVVMAALERLGLDVVAAVRRPVSHQP